MSTETRNYIVWVREVNNTHITQEAKSPEEAEELVKNKMMNGQILQDEFASEFTYTAEL